MPTCEKKILMKLIRCRALAPNKQWLLEFQDMFPWPEIFPTNRLENSQTLLLKMPHCFYPLSSLYQNSSTASLLVIFGLFWATSPVAPRCKEAPRYVSDATAVVLPVTQGPASSSWVQNSTHESIIPPWHGDGLVTGVVVKKSSSVKEFYQNTSKHVKVYRFSSKKLQIQLLEVSRPPEGSDHKGPRVDWFERCTSAKLFVSHVETEWCFRSENPNRAIAPDAKMQPFEVSKTGTSPWLTRQPATQIS